MDYLGKINPQKDDEENTGFGAPVIDFIAICVHSTEMGLVYVKDGTIELSSTYHYSGVVAKRWGSRFPDIGSIWPEIQIVFDKVDYILAYNIGIHRSNLKNTLEDSGIPLPKKKYACLYNWTKRNIGTTTLQTVCDKLEIESETLYTGYRPKPRYKNDYIYQATLIAKITIALQRDYGMQLKDAVVLK